MYSTPETQRAKAMAYTNQVAAEVQALFDSSILSGIKDKAKRLNSAKLIVAELLRADGKHWARQRRATIASATTNNSNKSAIYKSAIMKVAAQDLLRQWNASVNNNKNKGGGSGTYPINDEDTVDKSYTNAPQANPQAKNIKFPPRSELGATTSECVAKLKSDYAASNDVAVAYCTAPSVINDNNNDNKNTNTKSASIPSSIYALGLAQKPPTNTKVRLRNASADNNRPAWISTMKAMQRKTGLDPENIAYYHNDKGSNMNKLRSASIPNSSTTIPAVFKCSNMRFRDVVG